MNLYDTLTMLEGIKAAKPAPSFLKDNYFPTAQGDIFTTEKVTVDFENDTTDKLAPAVVNGAVPVQRDSYQTKEVTAPLIAPSMALSIEQLNKRVFNESIVSGMTPEQREAQYLANDLKKLDTMITRTEEYMAARTLLDNGYEVNQYVNGYGTALAKPFKINFYGDGNTASQAVYTPAEKWTVGSETILSDIAAMCRTLKKKGLAATDVILGANAGDIFLRNKVILQLLDNRRLQLVADAVNPTEVAPGATYVGRINANGNAVDVYIYDASYTDAAGKEQYFFDAGKVVVTAKAVGRTAYGAVSQYEEGATETTTYAAARVPHVVINRRDGIRELIDQSRPLVMPKHLNASISATVIGE